MLTWQKVLIVDDSKATSSLVARIVEQCGFQFAVEANNAKEALACMRRERFGLVLCDVEMPDMSGVIAHAAVKGPIDCSQGKRACLQLGDTADTCDARWRACMQSGCWVSGLVRRCGYAKH